MATARVWSPFQTVISYYCAFTLLHCYITTVHSCIIAPFHSLAILFYHCTMLLQCNVTFHCHVKLHNSTALLKLPCHSLVWSSSYLAITLMYSKYILTLHYYITVLPHNTTPCYVMTSLPHCAATKYWKTVMQQAVLLRHWASSWHHHATELQHCATALHKHVFKHSFQLTFKVPLRYTK